MQPCIDYCRHGKVATWNDDYSKCTDLNNVVMEDMSLSPTLQAGNAGLVGGGYDCQCPPGYEYDFNLLRCVDINECTHADYTIYGANNDQNICDTNTGGVCVNTQGDFYCACAAGQFSTTVYEQFGNDTDGYANPGTFFKFCIVEKKFKKFSKNFQILYRKKSRIVILLHLLKF